MPAGCAERRSSGSRASASTSPTSSSRSNGFGKNGTNSPSISMYWVLASVSVRPWSAALRVTPARVTPARVTQRAWRSSAPPGPRASPGPRAGGARDRSPEIRHHAIGEHQSETLATRQRQRGGAILRQHYVVAGGFEDVQYEPADTRLVLRHEHRKPPNPLSPPYPRAAPRRSHRPDARRFAARPTPTARGKVVARTGAQCAPVSVSASWVATTLVGHELGVCADRIGI